MNGWVLFFGLMSIILTAIGATTENILNGDRAFSFALASIAAIAAAFSWSN